MKVDGTELNTDIDKQKVLLWCLKLMLDPRILEVCNDLCALQQLRSISFISFTKKFSKINLFILHVCNSTVLFSYMYNQNFFWHLMFGGWMWPIYQLLLTLARSPFEHNICYKEGLLILVRIYRNCWSDYHLHFSVYQCSGGSSAFVLFVNCLKFLSTPK